VLLYHLKPHLLRALNLNISALRQPSTTPTLKILYHLINRILSPPPRAAPMAEDILLARLKLDFAPKRALGVDFPVFRV
jgi:hypothetical protein